MARTPHADADALIIGGGAAGLAAAEGLSRAGRRVIVLEARPRLGGRIHTVRPAHCPVPLELGAEFIHGKPRSTWGLLRRAALAACEVHGNHYHRERGRLVLRQDLWRKLDPILAPLAGLEEDMTFDEYLGRGGKKFPAELRRFAKGFVEGFEASDAAKIGTRALAASLEADEEIDGDRLYRPVEGYGRVIDFLAAEVVAHGGAIEIDSVVQEVRWKKGRVEAAMKTDHGVATRSAPVAVVTLPVGVLKAGTVRFDPPLRDKEAPLSKLEMGPVVKVFLQFDEAFWEGTRRSGAVPGDGPRAGMVFMHDEAASFPTWWTMLPVRAPILCGWAGGPHASRMANLDDGAIVGLALADVARLLGIGRAALARKLRSSHVANWLADIYSRGAYAYNLVGGATANRRLARPIDGTLYFAGEAVGAGGGTVAAALESGAAAAKRVLRA
jgi:monoamine oxidase